MRNPHVKTAPRSSAIKAKFPLLACLFVFCFVALSSAWAQVPPLPAFHVAGSASGPWPAVLSLLGLQQSFADDAQVLVLPGGAVAPADWAARLDAGAIVILEGDSGFARTLGFQPTGRKLRIRRSRDVHAPDVPIVWERAARVPEVKLPAGATVLSHETLHGTPLLATLRHGKGAVVWLAVSPGDEGYERFPFVLQTLVDLGVRPAFASRRLWAFFDAGYYRRDLDLNRLAQQWRQSGIAALHIGAWDFLEAGPSEDRYLRNLIAACHARGILVYAWLELPHVSTPFWDRHPEWREKNARLKDARVDWRLLMNLANPECQRAAAHSVRRLLQHYDWDGANLAELYFDGVLGIRNLDEFTPLNDNVRREVKQRYGFDPLEFFDGRSRNRQHLRQFLDYRVALAARLQEAWIAELEKVRTGRPDFDIVLTNVDDRFDTTMRDAIGMDSAHLLPLLERHDLTYIIEDPCTLWSLGPRRYQEIAKRYRSLTQRQDLLGVDINIVERQEAYPTAQQTGVELAQPASRCGGELPHRHLLLFGIDHAAGCAPGAGGLCRGHAHRTQCRGVAGGVTLRRRRALAGRGFGGRPSLAGSRGRDGLAARGKAYAPACGPVPGNHRARL